MLTFPKWTSLSEPRRDAWKVIGGLSNPSKMLGFSFGLPALDTCKVGSIMRKIQGSTCYDCYALKGSYKMYKDVEVAQHRRLSLLPASDDVNSEEWDMWIEAMCTSIPSGTSVNASYFRWHDAGDTHRAVYAEAIVEVAIRRPSTQYWIPTRESKLWGSIRTLYGSRWPSNLSVRVSAPMVGMHKFQAPHNLPTSLVHTDEVAPGAYKCPAPSQGGKCDGRKEGGIMCTACFNPKVQTVSYGQH